MPNREPVSIPFWVFWSSRRNPKTADHWPNRGFNPVLGFLVVSTKRFFSLLRNTTVSIPFWVFWSSRLPLLEVEIADFVRFQSRSGFSGRLDTTSTSSIRGRSRVSIPFWVFWSSRHEPLQGDIWFDQCFNPVLGFLVVSTLLVSWVVRWVRLFQSRSGFSGRLDNKEAGGTKPGMKFQSRSGFSGRLDLKTLQNG